jgi:hypothetical protein
MEPGIVFCNGEIMTRLSLAPITDLASLRTALQNALRLEFFTIQVMAEPLTAGPHAGFHAGPRFLYTPAPRP